MCRRDDFLIVSRYWLASSPPICCAASSRFGAIPANRPELSSASWFRKTSRLLLFGAAPNGSGKDRHGRRLRLRQHQSGIGELPARIAAAGHHYNRPAVLRAPFAGMPSRITGVSSMAEPSSCKTRTDLTRSGPPAPLELEPWQNPQLAMNSAFPRSTARRVRRWSESEEIRFGRSIRGRWTRCGELRFLSRQRCNARE